MKGRKLNLLFEIAICCLPALLFYGCFYLGLGQAAKDEYKISQKPDSVRFDLQNLWNMELPHPGIVQLKCEIHTIVSYIWSSATVALL